MSPRTPLDSEKIDRGHRASLAMEIMKPHIDGKRAALYSELKNLYREGCSDPTLYVAKTAALCAIDELESQMARQIEIANRKEKELLDESESRAR